MLAAAAADDQDPGRHDAGHAGDPRAAAHRAPGPLDRLGPLRPDRDEHDRDAGVLLERAHVAARVLGQVAERADVVDRLVPARRTPRRSASRARARRRSTARRRPAGRRPRTRRRAAGSVDAGQDVELVEHDAADAVDRDRVAQRDGVEPADPARPAGGRPELVAALGDARADLVVQLGRVRPRADARRVGLHDADDLVDLERADAAAGARAAGDRVGRGHERVAAVVEVEERALRALEQDVLAARQGAPGRARSCRRGGRRSRSPQRERLLDERLDLERRRRPSIASRRFLSGRARPIRSRRTSRSRRSSMRRPRRQARSPYVGPMPRPVVPTLSPPRRPRSPGRARRGTA